jgi:hypothetical protein
MFAATALNVSCAVTWRMLDAAALLAIGERASAATALFVANRRTTHLDGRIT